MIADDREMTTSGGRNSVRSWGIVVVLLGVITACNAAGNPVTQSGCGTCDEAERFVRLQAAAETGNVEATPPFAHPFRLSPEECRPILESVQVRRRGQGPLSFLAATQPTQQAFSPQEIQFLCETLPRVFAEAQPSEEVVFGLTNARTPEIADSTSGAWYVKGDTLYLVLSNYREGVTMPNIRELVRQQPLHMIAAPLYEFVPGPHQTVSSSHASLTSFLIPEAPQLALAYQAIAAGSPARDDNQDAGMQILQPPGTSLEDKLRQLKRLHHEGLITDEDYAAKKQALIKGL